jgi:hypothetical protein
VEIDATGNPPNGQFNASFDPLRRQRPRLRDAAPVEIQLVG